MKLCKHNSYPIACIYCDIERETGTEWEHNEQRTTTQLLQLYINTLFNKIPESSYDILCRFITDLTQERISLEKKIKQIEGKE